jgi:hypothetical protein
MDRQRVAAAISAFLSPVTGPFETIEHGNDRRRPALILEARHQLVQAVFAMGYKRTSVAHEKCVEVEHQHGLEALLRERLEYFDDLVSAGDSLVAPWWLPTANRRARLRPVWAGAIIKG